MIKLIQKIFTLLNWILGFNDPKIGLGEPYRFYFLLKLKKFEKSWNLIDIGAFRGEFSRTFSRHLRLKTLTLVEPNPVLGANLRELFPSAKLVQSPIWPIETDLIVTEHNKNPGQNFYTTVLGDSQKRVLRSVTLTEILNSVDTSHHTFVKIDIEGAEIDLIINLEDKLRESVSVYHLEISSRTSVDDPLTILNKLFPNDFKFFRETRFGMILINRESFHWSDREKYFQNIILINTRYISI